MKTQEVICPGGHVPHTGSLPAAAARLLSNLDAKDRLDITSQEIITIINEEFVSRPSVIVHPLKVNGVAR